MADNSANDTATPPAGQAPGWVQIGGDLDVKAGGRVVVPAGHTWGIDGDVSIGDGAMITIEDGATLQVQGHPEPPADSGTPDDFVPFAQRLLAPPDYGTFGAWLKEQPAISLADIAPIAARSLASMGNWAEGARQTLQQLDSAALVAQTNQISKMFTAAELPSQQFIDTLHTMDMPAAWRANIAPAKPAIATIRSSLMGEALFAQQTIDPFRPSIAEEWSRAIDLKGVTGSRAEKMMRSLDFMGATGISTERLLHSTDAAGIYGSKAEELSRSINYMGATNYMAEQVRTFYAPLSKPLGPSSQFIDALRPSLLEETWRSINRIGASVGMMEEARRSLERLFLTQPELRAAPLPVAQPGERRHQAEPLAEVQVVSITADNLRDVVSQALISGQVTPSDLLSLALTTGQATPQEMAAYLYNLSQQRGAGLYPPDWAHIVAVVGIYKKEGDKHKNQESFVHWLSNSSHSRKLGLGALSLATFKRWKDRYEAFTGEKVGPGKGKRKRR